jgi:hypothetical protein
MYYNKVIKIANILIGSIIIIIAILSSVGIIKDFALLGLCLIGLSLQMLLNAYNSYKMNKNKVEIFILSITGTVILLSTITSTVR